MMVCPVCGHHEKRWGLTGRQSELLKFIGEFIRLYGKSPSYEEMKLALNVRSSSNINRLVYGLRDRGYITQSPGKARSIMLVFDSKGG